MTRKADHVAGWIFALFLAGCFALNGFHADQTFSEKENRYLQTFPTFSLSSLLRGEYTSKMESYCSDQFFGRDAWIELKARLELAQGKKENNGIFLCRDERLIEPMHVPDPAQLDRQIGYVNSLTENISVPVTLALVPTSAALYDGELPSGVRSDDQREAIRYVYSRTKTANCDLLSTLEQHSGEYVYYRTDHHWTSLGARWGYEALAETMGFSPRADYRQRVVSEDFLGTAYSASGFFWIRPDRIETLADVPSDTVTLERFENDVPEPGEVYAGEMLGTKDKYRFFLGGNTPRAVIRTGEKALPSLLIIRDSFADSMVPFLLKDFSSIHLLDLRYYREPVSEYIKANDIDAVLLLYSTEDFFTDNNLALLTR